MSHYKNTEAIGDQLETKNELRVLQAILFYFSVHVGRDNISILYMYYHLKKSPKSKYMFYWPDYYNNTRIDFNMLPS